MEFNYLLIINYLSDTLTLEYILKRTYRQLHLHRYLLIFN
jgi:hypothetical protein